MNFSVLSRKCARPLSLLLGLVLTGLAPAAVANAQLPGQDTLRYAELPEEPRAADAANTPQAAGAMPAAGVLQAAGAMPEHGLQVQVGTGSIAGLVTDVNGGIVPGAVVSVLDAQGKVERKVTADSEGRYVVGELAPGTYKIRIAAEGLQGLELPSVTLKDGEHATLPGTALPIAVANQSVDVTLTQEEIAEEELKAEEKQRLLGFIPNFYTSYVWNAAPLTRKQKLRLSVRAFTDPYIFARVAVQAGVQQVRGTFIEYGDGYSGYWTRYAAAYGNALTGRLISFAVLPIIFHEDPRYFYMGTGGVRRRTIHALMASVLARTDKGHIGPNYTRTLGNFSAGYLSRTWHPGTDSGLSLAIDNTLIGIGEAAGRNLLQEFIYKRFSTGTPKFTKGKPVEDTSSALHP